MMGKEGSGLFLIRVCWLALLLWPGASACKKKQVAVASPPTPTHTRETESRPDPPSSAVEVDPVPEPIPAAVVPPAPPTPTPVQVAVESFGQGDCSKTIPLMEDLVGRSSGTISVEVAVPLALCYVSGPVSARNRARATELLTQIANTAGPVDRQQATLILQLIQDLQSQESSNRARGGRIRQLEKEVQGLKEIDIRRRQPRPPGD